MRHQYWIAVYSSGKVIWEPVWNRILTVRFQSKMRNIFFSPREIFNTEKEASSEKFNFVQENLPKGDIIIVIGDKNVSLL